MFKKAFAFISVFALVLAVPTWAYAVGRSIHATNPSGSTFIPGNQNHNQCLPPAGFVNTCTSYGLTIGDAQTGVGLLIVLDYSMSGDY